METQTPNFRLRLRGLLEGNQDVISELKKNIQMYNVHKDKVSPAYRSQMERIKRNIDFVVAGSQNAFICSYSFLFVKLILFNHYKRFNIPTKFVLLSFYCFTVEPFALASSFVGTNLYLRSNSFQNNYSALFSSPKSEQKD